MWSLWRVHDTFEPGTELDKDGRPVTIVTDLGSYELRLLSSVKNVGDIPKAGKRLVIVASVNGMLHFRIFNGDGNMDVDRNESNLPPDKAQQIGDLKKHLGPCGLFL